MTIQQFLLSIIARFFPAALFYKPTQNRSVALTIDDGPTPGNIGGKSTKLILEAITKHNQQLNDSQYHVSATFFIITEHLSDNSTIIDQIIDQGHEIANHGTRDRKTSTLSKQLFEKDFTEANEKLVHLSHQPIRWYRPGRAFYNQIMLDILRQFSSYEPRFALASMIPLDTFKLTNNPKFTAWYISQFVFPGAILVLHAGSLERDKNTAIALQLLLKKLHRWGYQVVTLSELWRS